MSVVVVDEAAVMDLAMLAHWIADHADLDTALAYVDRIQARFATLAGFPDRGTPRDDLAPGIRSLSFERRQLILYRVDGDAVTILRVVDDARDQAALLA